MDGSWKGGEIYGSREYQIRLYAAHTYIISHCAVPTYGARIDISFDPRQAEIDKERGSYGRRPSIIEYGT